jgi:hypothetical protein
MLFFSIVLLLFVFFHILHPVGISFIENSIAVKAPSTPQLLLHQTRIFHGKPDTKIFIDSLMVYQYIRIDDCAKIFPILI